MSETSERSDRITAVLLAAKAWSLMIDLGNAMALAGKTPEGSGAILDFMRRQTDAYENLLDACHAMWPEKGERDDDA